MSGGEISVDHIGIHVAALAETKALLCALEGVSVLQDMRLATHGADVAFLRAGNALVELIQWDDPNVLNGSPGRLDHLSLRVGRLEDVIARLKERGVAFDAEEPRPMVREDGQFRTISTVAGSTFGVRLQFVEKTDAVLPASI